MPPLHAMSFTPDVYEDDFGETHYDLNKGTFTSSAPVEAVQRMNEHQQEEGWYEDPETGNTHHHTQFDEQDIANVLEMNGGAEAYNAALEWAAYNLPQEDIQEYDQAISSGDLNVINDYVSQLMGRYNERTEEVSDMDDVTRHIFTNVISAQEYSQMREWIQANCDEGEIETWNKMMNSGDIENITKLIVATQTFLKQQQQTNE